MTKKYDFTGYRILVVEDVAMLREIEGTRLKKIGFTVDLAANGKEAVDLYLSHDAWYYQAILMDIIMPIMDGREAAKIIRTANKDDSLCLSIISISSDNDVNSQELSFEAGIDQFIEKPIDFNLLFDKLDSILYSTKLLMTDETVDLNPNLTRYDKLWKLLIDRKMTKTDLRLLVKFSSVTLAKISRGEKVSLNVLNKICKALNCNLEDIIDNYE